MHWKRVKNACNTETFSMILLALSVSWYLESEVEVFLHVSLIAQQLSQTVSQLLQTQEFRIRKNIQEQQHTALGLRGYWFNPKWTERIRIRQVIPLKKTGALHVSPYGLFIRKLIEIKSTFGQFSFLQTKTFVLCSCTGGETHSVHDFM